MSVGSPTSGGASLPRAGTSPMGSPREWALPQFERPESTYLPEETAFGRPLDSYLPGPLRAAWTTVEGALRSGVDLIIPEEGATPAGGDITGPLDRAREAQRALNDEHAMFGSQDRFSGDGIKPWRTEAWPLGQVLHGRVILAMQDGDWQRVDGIFREFESYRSGDGFTGGVGAGGRYYDDNEWIGLAAMQAFDATGDRRYLEHAERTFRMVRSGEHPDGGMYWYEQGRTGRHTCSVAPGGQLAMQLYEATHEARYLEYAKEQAAWMGANLRRDDGLYGDNLSDAGSFDPTAYSYNQGTPIGLDVQLYRATGEQRYLDRAHKTAQAALRHFGTEDRLWKQAPVFNAIFFRNLLALHAVDPDPAYVRALDGYLERAWRDARSPETGLFDRGGIGHYGDEAGSTIDQGALSQLYAIRALPPAEWATLA
ncbi:MAG: glycosyl hydrolase [Thermoleophilia bacterium]|nr:glycosyl hydrolase [Thermoleophilia bacterium]